MGEKIKNIISALSNFYNTRRALAIGIIAGVFLLIVVLIFIFIFFFKKPNTPTDPKAVTRAYDEILVTWVDSDKKSTGYNVYLSEELKGEYEKITTTYNRHYLSTDLESGITYYYKITKIKGNKESDYSLVAQATTEEVGAISNLKAEEIGNNYIKLVWDGFEGSEGFTIYRSEDINRPYLRIGTTKDFSYTDSDLEEKTIYYYAVTQTIEGEESDFSSQLTAATKDWQCGDIVVYDNKIYNTIEIGEQCWFRENLKYETKEGSFCYEDNEKNCENYGRLYDFSTAMNGSTEEGAKGLCPNEWHVPTDEEVKTLERTVGMKRLDSNEMGWRGEQENIGNRMKTIAACTQKGGLFCATSGFDLVMGGNMGISGVYRYIGTSASIWTSTVSEDDLVWTRFFSFDNTGVNRKTEEKEKGHFLRCLKN